MGKLWHFSLHSIVLFFALYSGNASASLIFTEILQNPAAVSDARGEWFEIYNSGETTVNIFNWTLSDLGSDTHQITAQLEIAPKGFLVMGRNGDININGGVFLDYVYSGITLGNGADELFFFDDLGVEVDRVLWDGGPLFPDLAGSAMSLSTPLLDNNVGAHWQVSMMAFGLGDFGTPGALNFPVATTAIPEPSVLILFLTALFLSYNHSKNSSLF